MDESWPKHRFISTEQSSGLDAEVRRVASTLASLSLQLSRALDARNAPTEGEPTRVEMIRSIIDLRRRRSSYLGNDLFADPAWDMMLKLLLAELMQVRVTVSDLCEGAAVPATTALRWQKLLVERNLVVRRPDPHDARRAFVELSPKASEALNRYFADVDATRVSGGGANLI